VNGVMESHVFIGGVGAGDAELVLWDGESLVPRPGVDKRLLDLSLSLLPKCGCKICAPEVLVA